MSAYRTSSAKKKTEDKLVMETVFISVPSISFNEIPHSFWRYYALDGSGFAEKVHVVGFLLLGPRYDPRNPQLIGYALRDA